MRREPRVSEGIAAGDQACQSSTCANRKDNAKAPLPSLRSVRASPSEANSRRSYSGLSQRPNKKLLQASCSRRRIFRQLTFCQHGLVE